MDRWAEIFCDDEMKLICTFLLEEQVLEWIDVASKTKNLRLQRRLCGWFAGGRHDDDVQISLLIANNWDFDVEWTLKVSGENATKICVNCDHAHLQLWLNTSFACTQQAILSGSLTHNIPICNFKAILAHVDPGLDLKSCVMFNLLECGELERTKPYLDELQKHQTGEQKLYYPQTEREAAMLKFLLCMPHSNLPIFFTTDYVTLKDSNVCHRICDLACRHNDVATLDFWWNPDFRLSISKYRTLQIISNLDQQQSTNSITELPSACVHCIHENVDNKSQKPIAEYLMQLDWLLQNKDEFKNQILRQSIEFVADWFLKCSPKQLCSVFADCVIKGLATFAQHLWHGATDYHRTHFRGCLSQCWNCTNDTIVNLAAAQVCKSSITPRYKRQWVTARHNSFAVWSLVWTFWPDFKCPKMTPEGFCCIVEQSTSEDLCKAVWNRLPESDKRAFIPILLQFAIILGYCRASTIILIALQIQFPQESILANAAHLVRIGYLPLVCNITTRIDDRTLKACYESLMLRNSMLCNPITCDLETLWSKHPLLNNSAFFVDYVVNRSHPTSSNDVAIFLLREHAVTPKDLWHAVCDKTGIARRSSCKQIFRTIDFNFDI